MAEINNQEQQLITNVMDAKNNLKRIKDEIAALQIKCSQAEKAEADAEAAYIAFMDECGIEKSECGVYETSIRMSEQVDIADNAAVPDDYMHEKISREPDKMKIKANRPNANWYSIKAVRNLQVKLKG